MSKNRSLVRFGFALLLVALAIPVLAVPTLAFADDAASGSACELTDELRAQYEADGTLGERIAYMEALGNDQADQGLVQQALARDTSSGSASARAAQVPSSWASGMGTEGQAYVLVLHVDFPDMQFAEGDTLEATRAMFDGSSVSTYPYENLQSYYERSSYGKLTINVGAALSYTAQHERSFYTNNEAALFIEALAAFDDELDYSQFDGNGDGYIDAAYIHFAGGDAGWGSTWWSTEGTISPDEPGNFFDGVQIKNRVLLHQPSNTEIGVRTAIHETGHVLGLPDYYRSPNRAGEGGILTFDMMSDNEGDQNGFSKWMLGWIPEEKITHIVANEDGMTVRKESEATATVYDGGDIDLGAFVSDIMQETGGIITVANEDNGIFSSYYLLQYDAYAGNQSVNFAGADGAPTPLSSGFRLYRIQSGLDDGGGNFAVDNLNVGSKHNQLIELVDPDEGQVHSSGMGLVPSVWGSDRYGCMWYAGDSVSPTSTPVSTNFYERINLGFTGLTIDFTRSDAGSGAVRVSYSNEDKPVVEEFSITPDFESMSNIDTLTFTTSVPVVPGQSGGLTQALHFELDGAFVESGIASYSVSGSTITIGVVFDPGFITSESTLEIVFPQGAYIVGQQGDIPIYNEEVRIPLRCDSAVKEAGELSDLKFSGAMPAVSDVLVDAQGTPRFFQVDNGSLYLHALSSDDPSQVESTWKVADGVTGTSAEYAAVLSDGKLFVDVFNATTWDSTCYWVDPEARRVVATQGMWGSISQMFPSGDGMLGVVQAGYGTTAYFSLEPQEDGSVSTHYAKTSADMVCGMNDGMFLQYAITYDESQGWRANLSDIKAYDSNVLVEALADAPTTLEAGVSFDVNLPESAVQMRFEGTFAGYGDMRAARAGDEFVLLLVGDMNSTDLLVRYDDQGGELARKDVGVSGQIGRPALRVAEYGSVAVTYQEMYASKQGYTFYRTMLFDRDLNGASSVAMAGSGVGAWLGSGAWMSVGYGAQVGGGAGSPDMDGVALDAAATLKEHALCYALTGVIDVAPSPEPGPDPDPEPTPDPDPDPDPQNPDQGSGDAPDQAAELDAGGDASGQDVRPLAATGDATSPLALAAAAAAIAAGFALLAIALRRMRHARRG